jgi:hypothetical protein
MARTQVADRGDGLQIWSVAANILNKQSLTADRGWPSSLGVVQRANNPHRKTQFLLRNNKHSLGPGRIVWLRIRTVDELLWIRWWTFWFLRHWVTVCTPIHIFSSDLCVQTGSGAHPVSCTMGTGGLFPGGKARPGRDADHSPSYTAEDMDK